MADLTTLRRYYYDQWVLERLRFIGVDGYVYEGRIKDWYEDGSLVFDSLRVYRYSPAPPEPEAEAATELLFDLKRGVLIVSQEIVSTISSDVFYPSDKYLEGTSRPEGTTKPEKWAKEIGDQSVVHIR